RDGAVWAKHEPAWGFLGSVVNLTCEATAEPAPRFEWRQPIKNHGKIFNITDSTSMMQVNITSEKVFGNYTCKVFNKHGYLFKTITLEAGEQPQPPEFVVEQAKNSELMIITILPPSGPTGLMAPTGFIVKYRLVDPKKPHGDDWKERYYNINSS
ncbi:Immunoglobulin, partial [Oryctes borbonicus]